MHKDIAKKPGRKAQKRHKTFNLQAGNRLAEMQLINQLYHRLKMDIDNDSDNDSKKQIAPSASTGSRFFIVISPLIDANGNQYMSISIEGAGSLKNIENVGEKLPKDLIRFILFKSDLALVTKETKIICQTEYTDRNKTTFRSHFDYRSEGFWYDWAMVTFMRNTHDDKKANVPAQILCFLSEGAPGNSGFLMVCHPCQWKYTRVTNLITKWTKHVSNPLVNEGIPYELVSIHTLCHHCLIIPDLKLPSTVYHILEKDQWGLKFM
jgi:hypothetical protein